ncbi:MAG: dTDP-glucose 4,6-dehydratase [Elusimicrobiales bacterium]|nr:dTDP-glucose 4,6-dehydratase [Elusimicrobiales bacterium]
MKSIMVTGGYGFIGSNFIRYLFYDSDFNGFVLNYDKLTYAANPLNLIDIEKKFSKRYKFIKGDICNYNFVKKIIEDYNIDTIVHFAAESHVDRSIYGPGNFIKTNIVGTFTLLEVVRYFHSKNKSIRFHHVSTDEVYGSLGPRGYFYETTPYSPRSPYSASKASSDHLVRAYYHTYGIATTLTNCSNNYGPYQFPEKLIPLMILNAVEGKPLPVYGDGKNVRDWLYVWDHACAIYLVLKKGRIGETYNIGGECEKKNIDVVNMICDVLEDIYPSSKNKFLNGKKYKDLITFVKDRPGHDRRYAINCDKIKKELGWNRKYDFDNGIMLTIKWYLENKKWVDSVRSGNYLNWIKKNYNRR